MVEPTATIPVLPNLNDEACRVCDAYQHLEKSNPPAGKCLRNAPQAVPVRFQPEVMNFSDGAGGVRQQPTGAVIVHIDGAWPLVRPSHICRQFKRRLLNGSGGVTRPEPLPELPVVGDSEVLPPVDVEAPEGGPL